MTNVPPFVCGFKNVNMNHVFRHVFVVRYISVPLFFGTNIPVCVFPILGLASLQSSTVFVSC